MRGHRHPVHRHGGPRGMRHFVRARLHRRLFFMMTLAIVLSLVAAFVVLHFVSGSGVWRERQEAAATFAAARFADVWQDEVKRGALADDAARTFSMQLRLEDASGRVLREAGGRCEEPWTTLSVKDGEGREQGRVAVCGRGPGPPDRWSVPLALLSFAVVLWLLSGVIAHRLGRPLWQLVQVTSAIGTGDLSARARLGRHHDGEVGVLAHSINDMAERIERQIKGQKELLAGVSHEIRTPLARLRVLTEMLRDRGIDEKLARGAEIEIEEIDDLTGRLLASSRLDFDGIERRTLDARDLAERALERAGLPKDLLDVETSDTRLEGDPTLLARALANLLQNAKVYGGGTRRLALRDDGPWLRFCVEDEGPGFAAGDLARVFSPFVRGSQRSAEAQPSSLGLGLHLVDRIARAHGGSANAENLPGAGARVGFSVRRDRP